MNDALRIEFHRDDRTYRSGETVRGEVILHTDRGESCRGVHLLRYWRTHGRGNADRGDGTVTQLHEGPLDGIPPYRLLFEFEAPGGPFTYHGALLNVDHYVEAQVDVAGLFDPGRAEEFIVVPGSEIDPPPPELLKVTGTKSSGARGCRIMVGALLILFGLFTLPFGVILLIPGLFLAFPGLTRALAGAKIGEVSSRIQRGVVPPGGMVRVESRLDPKKDRTINAATAVVRGREIVVSGKGSDRRVHTHEIHSSEVRLSGPRELPAGRSATLDAEIELPDQAAYTFASKHNEVTWEVTVSVDIPTWPDWHQEHKVVVWPSGATASSLLAAADAVDTPDRPLSPGSPESPEPPEDLDPAVRARAPAEVEEPGSAPEPPPIPEPLEVREARGARGAASAPKAPHAHGESDPGDPPDAEKPAPPASPELPSGSAASLATAISRILEEKSFGGGRDPLVRALVGRRFTFDLEVGLAKHTFGAGPDPTYRHGRTVTGSVAGTGISVEVRFPSERNDEIDDYRRGEVHEVSATVVDWEKLSETPVLEG